MNTLKDNGIFIRRARGANISRQTQRVYLCFDQANINEINKLIDDLISQDAGMDCVVTWPNNIDAFNEENIQNEIKETQVVVAWVTGEFLDSVNKNGIPVVFSLANEQNIPIFPIAQDEGLLPIFADMFSKIHGIAMNDPEYRIKLKKQLENLLTSENLKEQINSRAFTAEIFLSYRKVDLDDAREFMKDLHDIDGLQGISIWYDHFLTAGREFDIEIREAIEKSTAFVLLVTPNISKKNNAGELNYVAREEVPFAIEKEKTIVPVEVKPRDAATFAVIFPTIDEPVSKSALNRAFREKLGDEAYIKSLGSERAYLLGMAYLRGHRVERDIERAVKLLESAAEALDKPSLEASEQLAKIYEDGLGGTFPINYNKALDWWQKTGNLSERINGKNHQLTAGIFNNTGMVFNIVGEYTKALESHNKAIQIFLKLYGNEHTEVGITYSNIGKVYIKLGKSLGISVLYDALKIFQKNYGENHPFTAGAYMDIGINHIENETFAMLHSLEDSIYQLASSNGVNKGAEYALTSFGKALAIYKNIYGDNHYSTAMAHNYLGKVFIYLGKYKEAQESLNTALKTMNDIYGIEHLFSAYVYANLGLLYKYLNDYDKSLFFFNKVINIKKNYFGEKNIAIASMYYILGEVYSRFNKHEEALEYYIKDVEIFRENYERDAKNIKIEKHLQRNLKISSIANKAILKGKFFRILLLIITLPIAMIKNIPMIIKFVIGYTKIISKYGKNGKKNTSGDEDFDGLGANIYSSLNFVDKYNSIRILIKIKEKYINIADLCNKNKDNNNALKYYKLAMEIKKRAGMMGIFDEENSSINLEIGIIYLLLNNVNEAYSYCIAALKMYDAKVKIKNLVEKEEEKKKKKSGQDDQEEEKTTDFDLYNKKTVKLYNTLGQICHIQKKYQESLEFLNKAIEIFNILPYEEMDSPEDNNYIRDYYSISKIYCEIGKIHNGLGEFEKALINYNKALESYLYGENEDNFLIRGIIDEIAGILNKDTDDKLRHLDTIIVYYGVNFVSIKINRFNKSCDINITINNDNEEELARLYLFTGNIHKKFIEKNKAVEYFEKALISYKKAEESFKDNSDDEENHLKLLKEKMMTEIEIFGYDSIDVAKTCYSIGLIYKSLSDNEKRLEYYKKGLEIRIKVQGEENPDVATQYNNVAVAYNSIGDNDKAMEYHNRAISIRLKILGEEHTDTAISYTNIAYIYKNIEENESSLRYFKKALKIFRKNSSKNYKKQLEIYEEVISLQKSISGEENEKLALLFKEVGEIQYKLKDYKNALENAAKALEIRRKIYGDENILTASSYFNVGAVYYRLKDYQKSLEYHTMALKLNEKLSKDKNYDISLSLFSIGLIYRELKNFEKAMEYYNQALEINKMLFPEDDQRVRNVLECIKAIKDSQNIP